MAAKQVVYRRFTLAEIRSATGDFSEEHLIGKGGFGNVYKGNICIDGAEGPMTMSSTVAAIKRLASNSHQGETEFATEIETLTQLRHRNLVSLIGYCKDLEEMILVYEFMPNGTLADHLHNHMSPSLTWDQLLRICIGAARGLDYLHTGSSIIHRDVKSTNILLDRNFVAKVSDFGLAKWLDADNNMSHVSASVVKGTRGYIDPCYFLTGRLTKASDTYAFGVMMLEVLTGRRAVEGGQCLSRWAKEKIENGKGDEIVASKLSGVISEACFKTFIEVATSCLHDHDPMKRPTMSRVVAQLELAVEQQQQQQQQAPFSENDLTHVEAVNRPPLASAMNPSTAIPLSPDDDDDDDDDDEISVYMLRIDVPEIPLAEMKEITDGFSSKCLIYSNEGGGRGSIYHGVLKSGRDAAIKELSLENQKFLEEVSIVSRLKHEHVAELLGYYRNASSQFLAYEFAPRGSLHDILHGMNGAVTLSWAERIKIVVGAAKGLHCIHEKKLIHGSIKSSNVLIFDDGIAKITDFHLSIKCGCSKKDNAYADPMIRYRCLHHPPGKGQSEKGDVYGFGVILCQLLTGQEQLGNKHFWGRKLRVADVVNKYLDATLNGDYPPKAVAKAAEVAELCLQSEYKSRPDMGTVVRHLQIASNYN